VTATVGEIAWHGCVAQVTSHHVSGDGGQHLGLLGSRQRESRRSSSERCASLTTMPTKGQPGGVCGLPIPLPVRRRSLLLEISQHLRDVVRIGRRAVRRPGCGGVVERLAYEFEQIYACLRWAGAACWEAEEHVYDVLTFLALRFYLRLDRRARPWRQWFGFGRPRGHAEELHVLRQSVAKFACYGIQFFAVSKDFHVVVDEVEERLPFGLGVVVELHLTGAVQ
jgi:hypothetical protein